MSDYIQKTVKDHCPNCDSLDYEAVMPYPVLGKISGQSVSGHTYDNNWYWQITCECLNCNATWSELYEAQTIGLQVLLDNSESVYVTQIQKGA